MLNRHQGITLKGNISKTMMNNLYQTELHGQCLPMQRAHHMLPLFRHTEDNSSQTISTTTAKDASKLFLSEATSTFSLKAPSIGGFHLTILSSRCYNCLAYELATLSICLEIIQTKAKGNNILLSKQALFRFSTNSRPHIRMLTAYHAQ